MLLKKFGLENTQTIDLFWEGHVTSSLGVTTRQSQNSSGDSNLYNSLSSVITVMFPLPVAQWLARIASAEMRWCSNHVALFAQINAVDFTASFYVGCVSKVKYIVHVRHTLSDCLHTPNI